MTRIRSTSDIKIISSLQDLSGSYKAVLCDIWGVLHNGRVPFEGAVKALQDFRGSGGIVVMVSNAPRPSHSIPAQFDEIGVPRDVYDAIVTSGDATRNELIKWEGAKFLHIGPERDRPLIDGLGLVKTTVDEADFVLCSGLYDDETETPQDYKDQLAQIKKRDHLMICANPDLVVKRGDNLIYCSGAIAAAYEELGGKTLYGGKPYAPIYDLARKTICDIAGTDLSLSDLLMIGDGPKTDIFGAEKYGIDSLFVGGGIHSEESFLASGDLNEDGLATLFEGLGLWPHYVIPWLV